MFSLKLTIVVEHPLERRRAALRSGVILPHEESHEFEISPQAPSWPFWVARVKLDEDVPRLEPVRYVAASDPFSREGRLEDGMAARISENPDEFVAIVASRLAEKESLYARPRPFGKLVLEDVS
jgi:hypothetical protein